MSKRARTTSTPAELCAKAAELEKRYVALKSSTKPGDAEEARRVMREIEQVTSAFLDLEG